MKAGQKWLAAKLTSHASRLVSYRRDNFETVVSATIGQTRAEQDTGDGLIVRTEIRDYLIDTADLQLDGHPTSPEPGDQIVEIDEGKTFIFEVMPLGNQRAWRYSDPFRLKLRIHTRLVSSQES